MLAQLDGLGSGAVNGPKSVERMWRVVRIEKKGLRCCAHRTSIYRIAELR